jgi:hypothetical protein
MVRWVTLTKFYYSCKESWDFDVSNFPVLSYDPGTLVRP